MPPPSRSRWDWLRAWPMLGGALTALALGCWLLVRSDNQTNRDLASFILIVLGAALLGAWIVLHTLNHPTGGPYDKSSDEDG